jgi:hypothetical protein
MESLYMESLYLDCEFNGFGGDLISLALVGGDRDTAFYVAVDTLLGIDLKPWVAENVIPVIGSGRQPPEYCGLTEMSDSLVALLLSRAGPSRMLEVVADHPADFVHLAKLLDFWSSRNDFQSLPFCLCMSLIKSGELDSKVPHNALEDALALARWGKKALER